jgi:putative membrane protein
MLVPALKKNDKQARLLILTVSFVVFVAVAFLTKINLKGKVDMGFDVHVFALFNAVVNSIVTICLVAALIAVKKKNYEAHKKIMMTAVVLSALFLVSYVAHHLLAGETKFGDINHDGLVSDVEKANGGNLRYVYYFILATHIPLAAIIMPFILFTAYRGLTGEYASHKKLSRYTWPLWLYVSFTGVLVYILIAPYYG